MGVGPADGGKPEAMPVPEAPAVATGGMVGIEYLHTVEIAIEEFVLSWDFAPPVGMCPHQRRRGKKPSHLSDRGPCGEGSVGPIDEDITKISRPQLLAGEQKKMLRHLGSPLQLRQLLGWPEIMVVGENYTLESPHENLPDQVQGG